MLRGLQKWFQGTCPAGKVESYEVVRHCMSWDGESSPFVCFIYRFQSINISMVFCTLFYVECCICIVVCV